MREPSTSILATRTSIQIRSPPCGAEYIRACPSIHSPRMPTVGKWWSRRIPTVRVSAMCTARPGQRQRWHALQGMVVVRVAAGIHRRAAALPARFTYLGLLFASHPWNYARVHRHRLEHTDPALRSGGRAALHRQSVPGGRSVVISAGGGAISTGLADLVADKRFPVARRLPASPLSRSDDQHL